MKEVLFRNDELVVQLHRGADETEIVVVFDAYSTNSNIDRDAWGESYFISRNRTAIFVVGRDNDWYQYESMAEALHIVHLAVARAHRVLAYGVSMGAYAAVRFAPRIGAHRVLALSPQYSIHPDRASFENRWFHDVRRISFIDDLDGPIQSAVPTTVVYDPKSLDGLHAQKIASEMRIDHIRLPHSGHSVPLMLLDAGLLQPMVQAALDGTLDAPEIERSFRRARQKMASYYSELAVNQPKHRPRLAIALARRAVELDPRHNVPMHGLAQLLASAGEHEEAVVWYRKIHANGERYLALSLMLSQSLNELGESEQSRQFSEDVIQNYPHYAAGHFWHATLMYELKDYESAHRAAVNACSLDTGNMEYSAFLARIVAKARRARNKESWFRETTHLMKTRSRKLRQRIGAFCRKLGDRLA